MIVGCFTLDLYCENEGKYPDGIHKFQEFPWQYTGETRADCNRLAKKDGWKLTKSDAYCPTCNKKKGTSK